MYEWDQGKAVANFAKHGVAFESVMAFGWRTALVVDDDRHSTIEQRHKALGLIGSKLHMMIFTQRGNNVRIVSLRPANRSERKAYAEKTN